MSLRKNTAGSNEERRGSVVTRMRQAKALIQAAVAARGQSYEYQDKKGKISVWTKLIYGAPMFTIPATTMLISIHGTIFFTSVGAPLAFISFFTAAARSLDVITDPAMGYISDTCKRPEGRRRPFMFMGCWGYTALFILLFSPPASLGPTGTALWFGFFYLIFYLFDTLANVPYGALGPELTNSSAERNSVFFYSGMFKGVGILVAAALPVGLEMYFKGNPGAAAVIDVRCGCDARFPAPGAAALALAGLDAAPSAGVALWFNGTACASAKAIARAHPLVQDWCQAGYRSCADTCNLDAKRMSFFGTASFFGLFYLGAMLTLVRFIKERKKPGNDNNDPPLIPSLMATLRNRPFLHLLPAWVLDYTAFAMIGTMLPFYVQYVVAPDTATPWCDDGKRCPGLAPCPPGGGDAACCAPGAESAMWCETSLWLGVGLIALMGATILSMPCWLALAGKVGKFRAWLVYNMFTAVTNGLFVFVGKGDPKLCVALAFLNGLPNGAQFITESILADVIDYDEFLTGQRSEGRFTIFTTFIPKIVSIPAQALPLAALAGFGFVQPIDGVPQEQPEAVIRFIKLVFFVFPFFLALASFAVKATFPLSTAEQCEKIQEGIALHAVGKPAIDPVTKFLIPVFKISAEKPGPSGFASVPPPPPGGGSADACAGEAGSHASYNRQHGRDSVGQLGGLLPNAMSEEDEIFRFGYFFPAELQRLADTRPLRGLGVSGLIARARGQQRRFGAALVFFAFLTLYGLDVWIYSSSLSWLPALSVIGCGLSGCALFVARSRYKMALDLERRPPPAWLLDRYITYLCGINYVRNREECRRLDAVIDKISACARVPINAHDLRAMVQDMYPQTESVQSDAMAGSDGGGGGGGGNRNYRGEGLGGQGGQGGKGQGHGVAQKLGEAVQGARAFGGPAGGGAAARRTPAADTSLVQFDANPEMDDLADLGALDFDEAVDKHLERMDSGLVDLNTGLERTGLRTAEEVLQAEEAHHFASPTTTIRSTKVLL